jgi:plastocyanin
MFLQRVPAVAGAVNHFPRGRLRQGAGQGVHEVRLAEHAATADDGVMSNRIHSLWVVVVVAALLTAACGGGNGSTPERPAATAKADGPGTVTGKATFDGDPPARTPLKMAADPNCKPGPESLSESTIVAADKGLKNVFVYVKDGLGNAVYETPTTPVVLDQRGCRYEPHVFGVFAGQPVEIRNSDPTLHNIHAIPKANAEFNFGQPNDKAPTITKTFTTPEIGISFQCDVHGWMRAYANVVTHPFFAVTTEDGSFEIKGLKPGMYTIEAWHERLGRQTQQVTISDTAPAATAAFSFKPAA